MVDFILGLLPKDPFLYSVSTFGILVLFSLLAFYVARSFIVGIIRSFLMRNKTKLGSMLADNNVFYKLTYLIPAIIFYRFSFVSPFLKDFIEQIALAVMAVVGIIMINAFLTVVEQIYNRTQYAKQLSIKSYVQIFKIIINILGLVVVAAIAMRKDPTLLLSGIGAMTAVLMLIFKDTILSLVASLQISSNNLFKVGDWIEAPQFGADGDVVDIALHSVKIQNFDKTISVIPTYKFIDSPFKNWRGMKESGGRRIKRSLFIDMNSISFCSADDLNKFSEIDLVKEYIDNNVKHGDLTNVGIFRHYIEGYLRSNNNLHQSGMTFLVRQLEPSSSGLPIQIYVFVNDTNWVKYESVQSDIFDHLLAVLPKFKLRVFQDLTGADLDGVISK